MENSKILIGRHKICEYLQIKKDTFYELMKDGLPVSRAGKSLISHKDILDEYFRQKASTSPSSDHK